MKFKFCWTAIIWCIYNLHSFFLKKVNRLLVGFVTVSLDLYMVIDVWQYQTRFKHARTFLKTFKKSFLTVVFCGSSRKSDCLNWKSQRLLPLRVLCCRKMLECGMLERDTKALRRNSAVLCKQLVVDELLIQSLQADGILTENMAETIMVCEHRYFATN